MSEPYTLSEGEREALRLALHETIDGDFLIDAAGPMADLPISGCGAADVERWASQVSFEWTEALVSAALAEQRERVEAPSRCSAGGRMRLWRAITIRSSTCA